MMGGSDGHLGVCAAPYGQEGEVGSRWHAPEEGPVNSGESRGRKRCGPRDLLGDGD